MIATKVVTADGDMACPVCLRIVTGRAVLVAEVPDDGLEEGLGYSAVVAEYHRRCWRSSSGHGMFRRRRRAP